jgi:hypothetical protein
MTSDTVNRYGMYSTHIYITISVKQKEFLLKMPYLSPV